MTRVTVEDISTRTPMVCDTLDDEAAARRWVEARGRGELAGYRLRADGSELVLALGGGAGGQATWRTADGAAVLCEGDPDDAELRFIAHGKPVVVFGECRLTVAQATDVVAAFVASPDTRPPGDWVDVDAEAPAFEPGEDDDEDDDEDEPFELDDLGEHTATLIREIRALPARRPVDAALLAHAHRLRGADRDLAAYLDACAHHRDLGELAWGEWLLADPREQGGRFRLGTCVDGDPIEIVGDRVVRVSHETGEGNPGRFETFLFELDQRDQGD